MHNHFDRNLNFSKFILEARPFHIVECGAGTGECSRLIQKLLDTYNFQFTIISDATIQDLRGGVNLIQGLSYLELAKMPDNSIDFCIIDTDHNYWTLARELSILDSKLTDGGMVALHDTWFCYHDTGMAMAYSDGTVYPDSDILKTGLANGGLTDALIDFLAFKRFEYKLLAYTTESQGAALIQKKKLEQINVYRPAKDAPYAGVNQYEKSVA